MPVKSCLQSCYILTFIDDFSGYALVAFIHTKNAVPQHFHSMVSWAKTLVTCSPLFILTEEGNFWVKTYNHSSHPEESLIRPPFPILLNRMIMQRDSILPCLRKQKPCSNMPVCQSLYGKMLSRLYCIFIIANQCIIIIGKHSLRYSMEINLMFPTLEYLGLMLMSLSHKSSNITSCPLKQRR